MKSPWVVYLISSVVYLTFRNSAWFRNGLPVRGSDLPQNRTRAWFHRLPLHMRKASCRFPAKHSSGLQDSSVSLRRNIQKQDSVLAYDINKYMQNILCRFNLQVFCITPASCADCFILSSTFFLPACFYAIFPGHQLRPPGAGPPVS